MAFVTAQDITIPAGTAVGRAPIRTERHPACPFASILIGVTEDSTAEWTMPLDEALAAGLIKED